MISRLCLIFTVFFLQIPVSTYAQTKNDNLISGTFSDKTFEEFTAEIERQTDYQFYYDPAMVDSLTINLTVSRKQIESILDHVFARSDLHYTIDDSQNIYIVKGIIIQVGMLSPESLGENAGNKYASDFLEEEKEEKSRLLSESRHYDIGKKTTLVGEGNATIAGYIKSYSTGESIVGAAIYISKPLIGVSSDQFGFFSITLPKGEHTLQIRSNGMKQANRNITLYADGKLDIELTEDVITLKEIVVESDRDANVTSDQMGLERLDIQTMKKMPAAFGEVDIFKVVLTLPGVQTVGEGTSGLNVRGGSTSQNLIQLDDVPIYNPSHLFGFFSSFNPDVIKNVELYKSTIPAEFGGRLSSVLDVNSREGNKKRFSGAGGIGPVTGRLTLEGPIIKDKASFLIGGRSTYSDWLLKKIPNDALRNSQASFYDLNGKINYEINDKNSLYVMGYASKDEFKLNSDTLYNYDSKVLGLKLRHSFNNKLYTVLGGSISDYEYQISSDKNPVEAFNLKYAIRQTGVKLDFNYFPGTKHTANMGVSATYYALSPGSKLRANPSLKDGDNILPNEQGLEAAIYAGDHFELSSNLSLYAGIRFSYYQYLGPHDVFVYRANEPKSTGTLVDTVSYPSGKAIATYYGAEPRISINYKLQEGSALKLSYNRTRQYIQMLVNTTAISPTDTWKLSDSYIKPQVGDQISLGYYRNFKGNTIEASVETYFKTMSNAVDYKGGATLILNHHIETDLIDAKGKAYGIEVMIKKPNGKVNGWLTYTYSRSLLKSTSYFVSEAINGGAYYPSNYDKPHAFNLVGNYKFSHRLSSSLNLTYSTGRPITIPISKYYLNGSYRTQYGPRNGSRIPDYFRMDLSVNIEGNHKIKKLAHSSWSLGIYNITSRRNAYSVFFESQNGQIQGYKLSVLGTAIPTVTYNFKF